MVLFLLLNIYLIKLIPLKTTCHLATDINTEISKIIYN